MCAQCTYYVMCGLPSDLSYLEAELDHYTTHHSKALQVSPGHHLMTMCKTDLEVADSDDLLLRVRCGLK